MINLRRLSSMKIQVDVKDFIDRAKVKERKIIIFLK